MTSFVKSRTCAAWRYAVGAVVLLAIMTADRSDAAEPIVLNLWPGKPPGDVKELPPEADLTKPEDKLIAGRRIIKLGNVSTPQIAVYRPSSKLDTGAAVVICPGGGHHILAYDLEGTEVAEWLNSIGVTGIVLKYRVPFRDPERRWLAAVQDAQRALSVVRSRAEQWSLDPQRIGVCGFSAGGEAAGLAAIFERRQYEATDDIDKQPCRPNFAILVYSGGFTEKGDAKLRDYVSPTKDAPPMFFVHAFDDGVSVQNSLLLASELKRGGVSTELHVFATGGHGYGLRPTEEAVTRWPIRAGEWLRERGFLAVASQPGGGKLEGGKLSAPPDGFDARREAIEHGKLELVEYDSSTVGLKRKARVYTPPGYSKDQKYPVLYLLHGIGGDENEWARHGAPDTILDNLYADKKAVPMIVVLPNGRAAKDVTARDPIPKQSPAFAAFEQDLLVDLIPFIEKTYSVKSGRESRALAGLSMGGGQALNFGLGNLDTFAWVGGFSSAPNTKRPADLIKDPADASKQLRLLYVACGDKDGLFRISQNVQELLVEKKVPHVYNVIPGGGHDFKVWKRDLYHFSQLLFLEHDQ